MRGRSGHGRFGGRDPQPQCRPARSVSRRCAVGVFMVLLLVACSQLDERAPTLKPAAQPYGVLSGTVVLPGSGVPAAAAQGALPAGGVLVPGEVIVAFDLQRVLRVPSSLATVAGVATRVRSLALPGVVLYRVSGLDEASTRRAAAALAGRADVRFAEPNALRFPLASPNDPYRAQQWALPTLRLPEAWDLETGSASTVVAVVDTGMLFRDGDGAASHPDLAGRVLPGYDFISDAARANDGDGRDDDPYDAGDVAGGQASYHGTHVASIIAAATDNGVGMSGVDWAARLLPVRVLGIGGGTVADVIDGLLWAVGRPVPGALANPWPATVVNLSLGGSGACSAAEQAALDVAAEAGASVVVAAGNEDADAAGAAPANCLGVIAVGATDARDWRAWYSNYGAVVDIMAPGGDTAADTNDDGFVDGVLGAHRDDGSGAFDYVLYQGTSMAAAHVSGVVALARARDPDLDPPELEALLRLTARPLSEAACGVARIGPDACGAGLVDARAAVEQAPGFEPPAGDVAFDPASVDFGATATLVSLALTNVGGVELDWAFRGAEADAGNPAPLAVGVVGIAKGSPAGGTLAPGGRVVTAVVLDRSGVPAPGDYRLTLVFDTSAFDERVPVTFQQVEGASTMLTGPMRVVAWQRVGVGKRLLTGLAESDVPGPTFSMVVAVGETHLFAWTDENDNHLIDGGDGFGALAAPVAVTSGSVTTGLELVVERLETAPSYLQGMPLPP